MGDNFSMYCVHKNAIYNEELKNEFMNDFGGYAKKFLNRLFKITCLIEEELDKDFCEFTLLEIKRVLFSMSPKSLYSCYNQMLWLRRYVDFCIATGKTSQPNPLQFITDDFVQQFVTVNIKRLWSKEEILNICEYKLKNFQDKVIILLLFHGIRGTENQQIVNLKMQDVDISKQTIYGKVVMDLCINYCIEANQENRYIKNHGIANPFRKSDLSPLLKTDYIVKSVVTNNKNYKESAGMLVHRRIKSIAKLLEEPGLTPKNIVYSGMLSMAKNMYEQTSNFDQIDLENIFKYYNVQKQLISRYKKEFLNMETMNKIYPPQ